MEDLDFDTTGTLPGSVKFYQQHLLVCTGRADWPLLIEDGDPFIAALSEAVKAAELPQVVKLGACSAPSLGAGTDLLLYPAALRIVGIGQDDLPALLAFLGSFDRATGAPASGLTLQPLTRALFLICCHSNRDARCGLRGPQVNGALLAYLASRRLAGRAEVWRSSHVGGHRFAGNLLCYPSGNWYGRVTPDAVPRIVQAELLGGPPVMEHWRGRMGMTPAEQRAVC